MLKNRIRLFWRHIARQPSFAFINIFSAPAILIACLGLFGLSSYATAQRIREIGVHKVLGVWVVAFLIAVVTVRTQSWSASLMNPAVALRQE